MRRAVVHVEQNGIEFSGTRTDGCQHIARNHLDALVLQRVPGQRPQRPTIPLNHHGQQFDYENGCSLWKQIERRTQRESHPEAADKNSGTLQRLQVVGRRNEANASSEPCIRLDIRIAPSARIRYSSPRRISLIDCAVGRNRLFQQLERLHDCDVIGEGSLSKNRLRHFVEGPTAS